MKKIRFDSDKFKKAIGAIRDAIIDSFQSDKRVFVERFFSLGISMAFALWLVFKVAFPIPTITVPKGANILSLFSESYRPFWLHTTAAVGSVSIVMIYSSVFLYLHTVDSQILKVWNHYKFIKNSRKKLIQ